MNIKGSQNRYLVCGGLLILALTVLSFRVISLQYLNREDRASANKRASHYTTEVFPAHRGLIVDRNEEPLVVNTPLTDLYIDKYHIDDKDTVSWGVAYKRLRYTPEWNEADVQGKRKLLATMRFRIADTETPASLLLEHNAFIVSILAKPLSMNKGDLLGLLNDPKKKKIYIKKNLNEADAEFIRRKLKENHIRGIYLEKRLTRHYPSPYLATHLIGYTKDYQGETGLESRFNDQLSGTDGYHKRKSNPNNLSIASEEEEFKLPTQGLNLKLSIDTTIQSILEEELEYGLLEAECKKGCAIIIEPSTGDILALAGRPHYNLNTREGVAEGSRNYISKTALEPGSTFKVITAASALNEGLVNIYSPLIDCENGYYKDRSVILKDGFPRGQLSVAQILAVSSNIGAYKLGRQVGRKKFFDYVKKFGFGEPTGLNWAGEVRTRGTVGTSPQEFASATYGYAISATPMHMAVAYATVANNGKKMRPTLVKAVIANDGTVIEDNKPKFERRVIKEDVAIALRRAMTSVTEEGGTGTLARVPGYKVAGKTGTTRKWEKGGYVMGRYICSFGGILPADTPAFICYVVVDDPMVSPNKKKRYGGVLAAPIFSRIAGRTASYMNISPTEAVLTANE